INPGRKQFRPTFLLQGTELAVSAPRRQSLEQSPSLLREWPPGLFSLQANGAISGLARSEYPLRISRCPVTSSPNRHEPRAWDLSLRRKEGAPAYPPRQDCRLAR